MRPQQALTLLTSLDQAAVASVAWRCRKQDWREITATVDIEDPNLWAAHLCARSTFGTVAFSRDLPVAALGACRIRPGVFSLWMFATPDWPLVAPAVTRWCHRVLKPSLLRAGAHRAECASLSDHTTAHRWLLRFGFTHEATMPGWGKRGETFLQFSWVRPDVLFFLPVDAGATSPSPPSDRE